MARSLAAAEQPEKAILLFLFFDQSKHLTQVSFQTFIKDSLSGKH